MKCAGYLNCYEEIMSAKLDTPKRYEPFMQYFDTEKLAAIRDNYGLDLYKECYADALSTINER